MHILRYYLNSKLLYIQNNQDMVMALVQVHFKRFTYDMTQSQIECTVRERIFHHKPLPHPARIGHPDTVLKSADL